MIITITNEQVNSGKSTIAKNLAVLCAHAGRKVVLVDSTSQKKSYYDGAVPQVPVRAVSGKGLDSELQNLSIRYKDIVIDTQGRDSMASRSALNAARFVIVPVNVQEIDVKRFESLAAQIRKARWFNPQLRVLVVISCSNAEVPPENLMAVKSFVEKIPPAILSDTVIHEGDNSPDDRAMVEMRGIYEEVFSGDKQLFVR